MEKEHTTHITIAVLAMISLVAIAAFAIGGVPGGFSLDSTGAATGVQLADARQVTASTTQPLQQGGGQIRAHSCDADGTCETNNLLVRETLRTSQLTGSTTAFACIDESGNIYRSLQPCIEFETTAHFELNQPKTVIVYGKTYTVELVGANPNQVVITVGEQRSTINKGQSKCVSGVSVTLIEIFAVEIPEPYAEATLGFGEAQCAGAGKEIFVVHPQNVSVELPNGRNIVVGLTNIDYTNPTQIDVVISDESSSATGTVMNNQLTATLINGVYVFPLAIFVTDIPIDTAEALLLVSS